MVENKDSLLLALDQVAELAARGAASNSLVVGALRQAHEAISTLPIAVEGKPEPNDWVFEAIRAAYERGAMWRHENGTLELVEKASYDFADKMTAPSSPGKDGGQEDDRTEGFIAGYDEGLRQSKNEASIITADSLKQAQAVLKTIRRGALAPMGDVIAALTAVDHAIDAAPSKETNQ